MARLRLVSQLLIPETQRPRTDVVGAVRHLTGLQSQDLQAGLLAAAVRTADADAQDLRRVLSVGAVVRTWTMRGTLFLVAAEDVRMFLGLNAERVLRSAAARHRALGISEEDVSVARRVAERSLSGGVGMTRAELFIAFESAGQATGQQRGVHLLSILSHRMVLVQGPLRGRQQEFRLADEWLLAGEELRGQDALESLARRFVEGHGPADERDFAWWLGQPLGVVRGPFRSAVAALAALEQDGRRLFCTEPVAELVDTPVGADALVLLPMWDELVLGYRDRSAILPPRGAATFFNGGVVKALVILGGRAIGTWSKGGSRMDPRVVDALVVELDPASAQRLDRAAARLEDYWSDGRTTHGRRPPGVGQKA